MSWKTVYIDEECHISLQLENLKVKINDEFIKIPLSDLQMVIFAHDKMTITLPIINKLIEYNIGIITTNRKKEPIGMFLPFNSHSLVFKQLNKQINWNIVRKKQLWKIIIKEKILSEIKTLERLNLENKVDKLENFYYNVKSNDSTNQEGIAARVYFMELFGTNYTREQSNNINFALNYGYKILASYISRYITSRGFLTQIGIFHIGASNPYNLTYDFIEIFRYIIDIWVYHNVHKNDNFKLLDKRCLLNIINAQMIYDNKKCRVGYVIEEVINSYFNFLEGKINTIIFPKYESIIYV